MVNSSTVAILAAGLGTRMKSGNAKVLHRAGGLTLIEHVVSTALKLAPPERVFAIVGYQAEQVRAAVAHSGIGFVHQAEQLGTGHALMAARQALSCFPGPLLILYGDAPLLSAATLDRLVARQAQLGAAAAVLTTVLDDPTGYGRILLDAEGNIRAIVEQKAATPEELAVREINSGIYCFDSALLWKHLGEIRPDNPVQEYYLTDIIAIFRRQGYPVATLRLDDPSELLGINTRVDLAAVDGVFRQRKARELMLSGVTIEKPETVTIDQQVSIGRDTVIEPFTRILGATTIGERCRIGACAIVAGSQLADDVDVRPFTIIEQSRVAAGAFVGPYARLRMGNQIGPGAHVGNFVELKKTRLGSGAKANHLAYLGDSEIGAGVNIGAGTITCNYDGLQKHPTHIGDGAFIGSNSTLVAPLEIGPGSYVAAGSVVTDPVPSEALALGRARQTNKEGWARKRRQKPADAVSPS